MMFLAKFTEMEARRETEKVKSREHLMYQIEKKFDIVCEYFWYIYKYL